MEGSDGSAPPARDVRLLQAGWLTSAFDRFVVGPMLLSIAVEFRVSLDVVAAVASLYFLCYGLGQPLWGMSLNRFGRVRTMRVTMAIAGVAGIVSAVAPSLAVLVIARACAGFFIGGVVPAGLVYVGDVVPFRERQRTLTDLNAALAGGVVAAIVLGGLLASELSWRVGFLIPAVASVVLSALLGRLPEPSRDTSTGQGYGALFANRWSYLVLVLGLLEGAALLSCLTYFAPVLESGGASPTVAGLIVGVYGIGLLMASLVVKRLARSWPAWLFLVTGALGVFIAYLLVAGVQSPWSVGAAALLLGAAWAPMTSTMQAWATEAVPHARAAMVSMFVALVFVGGGIGTAVLAPLAAASDWASLFFTGAILAAVFGVSAPIARSTFHATVDESASTPARADADDFASGVSTGCNGS